MWEENKDKLSETIADHPSDSPEGYILEADLEYPVELHEEHNAYPLAPERMVVQKEWMSEYQHNLLGVGVAPTEVENWSPTSAIRTAMCSTTATSSSTYLWACV